MRDEADATGVDSVNGLPAEGTPVAKISIADLLKLPRFSPSGIGVAGGRWVVHLVLQEGRVAGQQIIETPMASVDLPWALAKAAHQILGEAIADYERQNGELAMPGEYLALREQRRNAGR